MQQREGMRALLSLVAALVLASPALGHADEPEADDGWPQVVVVPYSCALFAAVPGGKESPVLWDHVLSFASCIQDATVLRVETAEQVDVLLDQLSLALLPAVQFQLAVLQEGPRTIRLRAAYHIALGQLTLVIRARASLAGAHPALRARLEPHLISHARLAWEYFATIGLAARHDPTLATDDVTRNIVRASAEYARQIERAWSFPEDDGSTFAFGPTQSKETSDARKRTDE